jgi:flagellar hook protein FlgE
MSVASVGAGPFYAALSGMQRESDRVAAAAGQIVSGNLDPQPAVDMNVAAVGFKADAKVAEVANQMSQTLLDIKV